jgi:2Fe-2S ferredoxin
VLKVTYIDPHGMRHVVETYAGRSLMRTARDAGVPGIIGECGGCMTCGTCHIHIVGDPPAGMARPSDEERDLLDALADRDETSRLSCQIRMSEALTGMVVRVAPVQG